MKHILLLNLHQKYDGFANGNLTHNLMNEAQKFFLDNGDEVKKKAQLMRRMLLCTKLFEVVLFSQ